MSNQETDAAVNDDRIVALRPAAMPEDGYELAQARLLPFLQTYTLNGSYRNFIDKGLGYPFAQPEQLLPAAMPAGVERYDRNTVFVVLLDGHVPTQLNRHFRLRSSNRVTWRNLQRFSARLDADDFKPGHCHAEAPEFERLLRRLVRLDYALLLQRHEDSAAAAQSDGQNPVHAPIGLTHMHMKVERLTDNAIKDLARSLGYIERRLFERGEDYVEALESKFFEYFGFAESASGRKSAAAMAAQLLESLGCRYAVYVAGHEDGRLTVLNNGHQVTQYMIIPLNQSQLLLLAEKVQALGLDSLDCYLVSRPEDPDCAALFRVRYRHSLAAQPKRHRDCSRDVQAAWLEIADSDIVALPGQPQPDIAFDWQNG